MDIMPYEMRRVSEFATEGRRQVQNLRNALKEVERRRAALGGDFMNEQRFRKPAADVKQLVAEMERTAQKLTSALDDIDRLTR
jgi:hypothetical protein